MVHAAESRCIFNKAKLTLDQQSLRFKGLVSRREAEYWKEIGIEMTSDLEKKNLRLAPWDAQFISPRPCIHKILPVLLSV
jgi:hypothetical protein